jgi:hypothetical protein
LQETKNNPTERRQKGIKNSFGKFHVELH